MSFWKDLNYDYLYLINISEDQLMPLINAMNRQDIIEWLIWNDHNGVYADEHSLKEFGKIMTRDEGLEIILRQIEENRVPS
jgi:hypothetical protein